MRNRGWRQQTLSSLSPCKEREGRESKGGALQTNGPPFPSPLLPGGNGGGRTALRNSRRESSAQPKQASGIIDEQAEESTMWRTETRNDFRAEMDLVGCGGRGR